MASPFSRSRAFRLARRLAVDALGRLAREVDRLSMALDPPPSPLPLQRTAPSARGPATTEEPVLEVRPTRVARPTRSEPTPSHAPIEPPAPPVATPPTSPRDRATAAASPSREPAPPGPTEPRPTSAPIDSLTAAPAVPPPPAQTPGMAQVAHLRRRLEPHLALLHGNVDWKDAEDPIEALRRLRVATRRLRAFTRLFAPMLGAKRARRLHKQLRRVTRGVGPLREWDVLLEGLHAEHAQAPPLLRAALEHVIVESRRQRDEAARRAEDAVSRVDVRAVAEQLDRQLDLVCGRLLRLDDGLPAQVWTLLEPTLERAFDRLPRPQHDHEVEPLHEVRVRAKRLRYALELLRPALGEAYRPLRKPAKRVQRAIGEHHDRSLLASVLGRHRAVLGEQGLSTLAEALRPLEERLLAERRTAHASAAPALELLDGPRYRLLATRALGIESTRVAAPPEPSTPSLGLEGQPPAPEAPTSVETRSMRTD